MLVCDRCGESYPRGSKYSTSDYCGTCTFIHGSLPEPNVDPPPLKYIDRANLRSKDTIDPEPPV